MSEANDHVVHRLDDYLHGLLTERETGRVEGHCSACAGCRAALEEARQLQTALASVPPTEASAALVNTTLRRIHGHEAQRKKRAWRAFFVLGFGTAAAVLVLGLVQLHYEHLTATPYDLVVLGQRDLLAATNASLRVRLFDRRDGRVLRGVPVKVELRRGREAVELAHFETDENGRGAPQLRLPDWSDGDCTLRVVARTPGGDEEITRPVRLRRSWKLMLSSDKPVYQPGQTIHVRSLALRRPDLLPVADQPAVFTLTDPRGNVLFKDAKQTSRFGIAGTDCELDSDIQEGLYTLGCKLGDTESKLTIEVKRYVLPKFRIALDFDRPFYQPAQLARLKVHAAYFFGKPVAGGEVRVEVRGPGDVTLGKLTARTDEHGEAKLAWDTPGNIPGGAEEARVVFEATVTDNAAQEQTHHAERVITTRPVRVEVLPEGGELVKGVRNRVYLFVRSADGAPVQARVSIMGVVKDLKTDNQGIASFEYIPRTNANYDFWNMRVRDDAGNELATQQLNAASGIEPLDFLLRTDRAVYASGDTVQLTALSREQGPVFVDFLKDGQTALTRIIDLEHGRGELALDLPLELSGTLQLCAYRFDRNGAAFRKTRALYVRPANQVHVTAKANATVYRPGGKATVHFTLTDRAGKPVPGALSLAGVDEAVFGVLTQRPGMEQTFYLLEKELLQPVYSLYPWSPDRGDDRLGQALFAKTTRVDVTPPPARPQQAAPAEPPPLVSPGGVHTLAGDSYPEKLQHTAASRERGLQRIGVAWIVLAVSASLAAYAALWCWASWRTFFAVHALGLCALLLVVGVHTLPLMLSHEAMSARAAHELADEMFSVGRGAPLAPDWGGPTAEQTPAQGGERAVGAFPPAQSLVVREEPTPRVRERFPETLLWRPELITDDQGRASLDIDLADSITTWRLSAGAVTADGRLGSAQLPLKVFQPFFADLNLPPLLTRGDEIDAPVVVYNYLDKPQTVTLALVTPPELRVLDGADRRLDLGPGEVRSVRFRLRAVEAGTQLLEVTARGSGVADALRRTLDVVPDGRPVEQVVSGSLDRPASVVLDLPAGVVGGSARATLKVYPSAFSQLMEGLQNIFRMPYGCFEQTSSTTYPNVLALDYLRRTGQKSPAVEATARQYIHLGYQRLVGFEVPGGGFDWFGRPPANRTLTAYGLMEFEDMARVHDVDGALIDRTRRWLLSQRGADGAWDVHGGIFHDDLTGGQDAEERRLATTAYAAWAVFARGQAAEAAPATRSFLLRRRPDQIRDPHVLALVSNALLAMDRDGTDAAAYLDQLEARKQTSPDGRLAWWEQPAGAQTCFYGSGQTGQVETTALAALALMEGHRHPATARTALEWLIRQKDAGGTWHSTQATVLALKALLAGTSTPLGGDEARHIEVRQNGKVVRDVVIPAGHEDVLTRVDLSVLVAPGRRRLEVVQTAGPASGYQVTLRYHVPGPVKSAPADGPLAVTVDYDRTELALGDVLRAHVRVANNRPQAAPMVMLDLPVPPGFTPEADDFAALVREGKIERFQVRPRQVLVYLRGLAAGRPLECSYRLRPALAGSVSVPGAHAYEYYAPEVQARCGGCRLSVKP
jgi:uncharacterized protein YfaS (alpha-2-macroglobulin family)